jgi:hypothetical protein
MNKVTVGLIALSILFSSGHYYGSTTAPVTIAGGIIKSRHTDDSTTKYKRKDCPVCKGTGWYMSGDKIKKIECNYCEPEKTATISVGPIRSITPVPPTNNNCPNGVCPLPKKSVRQHDK